MTPSLGKCYLAALGKSHRQVVTITASPLTQLSSLSPVREPEKLTRAESESAREAYSGGLDRSAILLSSLCVLHCLAIPIAMLALPVIGDHLLGSETLVHWLLLAPAVPVSSISLWSGYKRHRYMPGLLLGAVGLLLMFIGVSHLIDRSYEIPLTVTGVLLVTVAHVLNLRRIRNRH